MREGDALLRAGDLRGACASYQATIELLPTWWMPHLALVRCGRFVGLPLPGLLEHAQFAARARPRIPITHAELGMVLEELGRDSEALTAYRDALTYHPDLVDVQFRLGALLLRLERPREALAHLTAVVMHRPTHVVARRHLARTYEQLGNVEEAEKGYVDLVTRSRFRALALSRLIRFYERHRMVDKAAQARGWYAERYR